MGMGKGSLGGGSIYRKFTTYPRCQLFSCPRQRGVSYRCCFYCERKEKCSDHCLNSPSRCGMCIVPKQEDLPPVIDIPDDPMIRKMELYGTLHPEQEEGPDPICPICGKECDFIFTDIDGDCAGCENCLNRVDAYEWKEKHKE